MSKRVDVSNSLWLAFVLSISGGLMDAYSYLARGGVFANAQTGNILLFGIHLTSGSYHTALRYLLPVVAFAIGIAIAVMLRLHFRNRPRVHWRQIVVIIEALLFACVAFVPQSMNLLANSLISLACGAQVESFRKIGDHETKIATTMCIGNLHSGVQALCEYHVTNNKDNLKKGICSFVIIIGFVAGAICGNYLVGSWEENAILCSSMIMVIAFCVMMLSPNRTDREQYQKQ